MEREEILRAMDEAAVEYVELLDFRLSYRKRVK